MKSHSRLVRKRIKGTRSVAACWSRGVAALDEVTRVQGCTEGCMRRGDVHTYITLFFLRPHKLDRKDFIDRNMQRHAAYFSQNAI